MKFDRAKAETQAVKAISLIQSAKLISSVGTNRNYKDCLTHVAQYIKDNRLGDLRQCSIQTAERFLQDKASEYSQKTLDMHRQALQSFLTARGDLASTDKLTIVESQISTVLSHRAYSKEQVNLIANAQTEKNSFATQLAYACGLRAHELLTIRPLEEQPADIRRYEDGTYKNLDTKWLGRAPGIPYSVVGKGGLIREIRVPVELANRVETFRLDTPVQITDRNVRYESMYAVAGGQKWSNSFSAASTRALGWSTGAHGLRHSYAQERLAEVQNYTTQEKALETVSQEMGHFRADITKVYLR